MPSSDAVAVLMVPPRRRVRYCPYPSVSVPYLETERI
jgi:hypothetical protein